jgi:hypothetical protein
VQELDRSRSDLLRALALLGECRNLDQYASARNKKRARQDSNL